MNYLRKELYDLIKSDDYIFDWIQASSLDGLWYWDLERMEEEWMNPKFWTTLGYDPAEMPHKAAAWQDIIFPEDLAIATTNLQKHIADPTHPYDQVVRYRHKNGSIVWIRCRGLAIRDQKGKAIRVLGAHTDITPEKRKEQLLTETNRAARIGAWEIDLVNDAIYWSEVTKEIHEVPYSFVPDLATAINFYKEGESRTIISQCIEEVIAKGKAFDVELQLLTAAKKELWVRVIGQAEFYGGVCKRIFGTFQDIEKRKLAEIQLQKERKFLQKLIDSLPVNVYVKNLASRKILVNKQELAFLGAKELAEVLKDDNYYPPDITKITLEEDRSVFATGQPIINKETLTIKNDGTKTWFLISKIPLFNEEGKIDSLLGISYDITKYKEAEEMLRKYSILETKTKEMEQFAYIVSHDLREPLTSLQGYITLLIEEFSAHIPEDAKYILDFSIETINRMDALVHELLSHSRLSQVKELAKLDCYKILQEVLVDLSASILKNEVEFEVGKLPTILAYPVKIKQLFQNLISNAIKFRKKNVAPVIFITSKKVDKGWQFQVKDNGIGIPEGEKERIFQIFQRLNKEDYEGTGIGLANCKKIVELHNGGIWVTSKLGEGSTFYFTILTEEI